MAHGAPAAEIDLQPLRTILEERYKPDGYQDSLELIVQACQEAQHLYGYVPKAATELIADHLGVSSNRIFGLLTFYADFLTAQPGQHTMLLCHGTACYVGGSQKLVDHLDRTYDVTSGKTTKDGTLTVQIVNGCLGVCDLAPVAQLDHHDYCAHLTVETFETLMDELRAEDPTDTLGDSDETD